MANVDTTESYRILSDALRERGLDWILDQVQTQIRSGKQITKDVTPYSDSDLELDPGFQLTSSPRRRARQTLAATQPYSSLERLEILIDAIETALVRGFQMKDELFKALSGEGATRIRFEPDELDESERMELVREPVRMEEIDELKSLLDDLRRGSVDAD